jgi:hypothetical protein
MMAKIFEGLVVSLGLASVWMMIYGVIHQEWWSGFGLVLLMTTVLCWFSIFRGARMPAPPARSLR